MFDGVIAGAPAIDFWAVVSFYGYAFQDLGFNTSSVTLAQWAAVQQEILSQCDGLDGAKDGILEDPAACIFDWKPLVCSTVSNSSTCLTTDQVEAAAKLFRPITYNGQFIHPGHNHGYEPDLIGIEYSGIISTWLLETFRYVIYENPSWDLESFTIADVLYAIQQDRAGAQVNTFNGDISAFRDRGGKILHWHGLADQYLSSRMSDLYYNKVRSTLKASVADLNDFYRYFRASGVGHCSGGPGANFMGQLGGDVTVDTPDDSMLRRIIEWVEEGDAPEFVRGTKFINDTAALGIDFTRRHCKYPKVNRYFGEHEGLYEGGWTCVGP